MTQPVAYVCQGKKCSRACAHDALLRKLCQTTDVHLMRCQGICHGSVVAVRLDGDLEWFERIDRAKLVVALKNAARGGRRKRLSASLKKRRLKRLSGSRPR